MKKHLLTLLTLIIIIPNIAVGEENNDAKLFQMLELFGEVFDDVKENYVDEIDEQEMMEAAINGMLSSLDPHSSYLNEEYYRDLQTSTKGKFGGLGIEISLDPTGYIKVISPIDDTPAFKAGILAGDLITHIDDVSVLEQTLADSVKLMRGEVGTSLTLRIAREGVEAFDVDIERDIITIRSVSSRIEGRFGYLRITSFSDKTAANLIKHIEELQDEANAPLQGFVLDLRNNPGGLLIEAAAVSDVFLNQGEIVSTRGRGQNNGKRFLAKSGDVIDALPLIVLINGGSASASEIVAGALQDHERAVILGTQSFGKGSVQTIMPLSKKDTAIKLTTQLYYTPSGKSIQALGITPDIEVAQNPIQQQQANKAVKEADLSGAIENSTPEDVSADEKADIGFSDDALLDAQLLRALEILTALTLYNDKT